MSQQHETIAFVGAGNIGALTALKAAEKGLADRIVLVEQRGKAASADAKAKDISQALSHEEHHSGHGRHVRVEGSDEYHSLRGADIVVVTAGLPRKLPKPGEPLPDRNELLKTNAPIIAEVAEKIRNHAPRAFVIVVTNPLDTMVEQFRRVSRMPPERVVGMAGELDAGRMSDFLSQHTGMPRHKINSMVLGGHGDAMVPLPRHSTVDGVRLDVLIAKGELKQEDVDAIIERTRKGGGEIVKGLGNGSAWNAPASSVIKMIRAYQNGHQNGDRKPVLGAAYLNGEYGENGLYAGVPMLLGPQGVEKIIELELNAKEQDALRISLNGVKEDTKILHSLGTAR